MFSSNCGLRWHWSLFSALACRPPHHPAHISETGTSTEYLSSQSWPDRFSFFSSDEKLSEKKSHYFQRGCWTVRVHYGCSPWTSIAKKFGICWIFRKAPCDCESVSIYTFIMFIIHTVTMMTFFSFHYSSTHFQPEATLPNVTENTSVGSEICVVPHISRIIFSVSLDNQPLKPEELHFFQIIL